MCCCESKVLTYLSSSDVMFMDDQEAVVLYFLIFLIFFSTLVIYVTQAHLLHPTLIDLCLRFYSTTAQWMVHLVMESSNGHELPDEVHTLI